MAGPSVPGVGSHLPPRSACRLVTVPSALSLPSSNNAQAEAVVAHVAANYPWLECVRVPLPSDFEASGMLTT